MNAVILDGVLKNRVLPVIDVINGYYYIKAPFWGGPWAYSADEIEILEDPT